jgi:hypothetical protein
MFPFQKEFGFRCCEMRGVLDGGAPCALPTVYRPTSKLRQLRVWFHYVHGSNPVWPFNAYDAGDGPVPQ